MSQMMRRSERERGLFPSLFGRHWNNDFFNGFMDSEMPAVNVKENDKEFKLEISAPGYDKNEIEINIDKNILNISAKKEVNNEEKGEDDKILRQEFTSSSFYRSFSLPENVDIAQIEATQNNGVLNINLPKMDKALEEQKKKIEIK